ncbi:M-phase phosphoprotein 6, animal type [Entomortierella parvispora]|uniref:M-phase phosphoprotein 6, animal type n=1 Tax=Entomortierella parvispora TaxID=205924 RepID=A0A9P3H2N7_9FUNG|nr:M-phase phosphoprotein 6, animal type [Entomortierella parvispora]
MADNIHKKALSGKLLTMKFMQRQQEQETRKKLEQEQVRVVTEAHWVLDRKGEEAPKPKFQVEIEPSFLQMDSVERSSVGRVSFQKFNENVEKTATKVVGQQQLDRELKRERQMEVGDEEMAKELALSNKAKKAKTSLNSISGGGSGNSGEKKKFSNRRVVKSKN